MKRLLLITAFLVSGGSIIASEEFVSAQSSKLDVDKFVCSQISSSTKGGTTAVVSGSHPDYVTFKNCMIKKGYSATQIPQSVEVQYTTPIRFGTSHGVGGGIVLY